MADATYLHEFHHPPKIVHDDISLPGADESVKTHRRLRFFDAYHDPHSAAPIVTVVVPLQTILTHDAFNKFG